MREWVVLTNASAWRLYHVIFAKAIDKKLVIEIDLTMLDLRDESCADRLAPFMKEGFAKGIQQALSDRQDATSRYLLSALLLENPHVIARIRRELRRIVDVLVGEDEIIKVLGEQVIKRDAVEGPEDEAATKLVRKALKMKTPPQTEIEAEESAVVPAGKLDTPGSACGPSAGVDG